MVCGALSSPPILTARPFSTVTHTPHSILPQPRQTVRIRRVVPSLSTAV